MIIDAHTHLWRIWPYHPLESVMAYPGEAKRSSVPNPLERAQPEQLLFEMDMNEVDIAVVVCLSLQDNPDNNDYVSKAVAKYPDRLVQFADIDGFSSDTYHTPGAAERLEAMVSKLSLKGFSHYLKADDDGSWFLTDEGTRFLTVASRLNQIVSISCPNPLGAQPILRKAAERFPTVPFVVHHLGHVAGAERYPFARYRAVLDSSQVPNIYVKLSGPYYVAEKPWDFPYHDCHWIVRGYYEFFGPGRLLWGSDYPNVCDAINYRQSLEWIREHLDFISPGDIDRILGGNMNRLLGRG